MRKVILMVLMAVGIAVSAAARETVAVQPIEGEVWVGMDLPVGGYYGGKSRAALGGGFNLRYNIRNTPFDCGVFFAMNYADRMYMSDFFKTELKQSNRSISVGASFGYNFRQGKTVNPFASFGLGVGFQEALVAEYPSSGTTAVFIPKVGVELLSFIRLNGYFQLSRRGYNNFGLSVGVVLGGRPRQ